VEITQKNDCTMPPLLHTANLLSSLMAVIKGPLGGQQDIFEEPQGKKKKKPFLWSKWLKIEMLGAVPCPRMNLQIRWKILRAR